MDFSELLEGREAVHCFSVKETKRPKLQRADGVYHLEANRHDEPRRMSVLEAIVPPSSPMVEEDK